jgi:hypothetical protein
MDQSNEKSTKILCVCVCFTDILPRIANKIQRCTILFIVVSALHVSGGFSAHHQEHKTVQTASGMC